MNEENDAITKTPQFYLVMLILIVMVLGTIATAWRTLELGVMAIGAWKIWTFYQQRKQSQQAYLKDLFYQLIQENQGYITALDLAMKANISARAAGKYLERRAREFAAEFEVNQQGAKALLAGCARLETPPKVLCVSSLAAAGPVAMGEAKVETDDDAPTSNLQAPCQQSALPCRPSPRWSSRVCECVKRRQRHRRR